jgi:hypothetical protein
MIEFADKDRDGVINFEEFAAVVTKVYPKIWKWSKKIIKLYFSFWLNI